MIVGAFKKENALVLVGPSAGKVKFREISSQL